MAQIVISDIVTLRDRYVDESRTTYSLLDVQFAGVNIKELFCALAFSYCIGPITGGVLVQKGSWRVSDPTATNFGEFIL